MEHQLIPYDPLDGDCGINILGKDYIFSVRKLIKFIEKNYKSENIKIDNNLKKIRLFKDIEKSSEGNFLIQGKWIKSSELSDAQWDKFKIEQKEIMMKANLKYPIIVSCDKKNKITSILDGNHRIEKALLLNKKLIKAYKIPEKDFVEKITF